MKASMESWPWAGNFRKEVQRRNIMKSRPYKDIIDEKTGEWLQHLEELQKQMEKASPDIKNKLDTKIDQLKPLVNSAIVQLRNLDEQESADTTLETKDRILEIFSSIDQSFSEYQKTTPFML
jgi:seryl-tRNA synthetase